MTNFFSNNKFYSLFQTTVLGLLITSFAVSPNVLAQNIPEFNVSVYNNTIKGNATAEVINSIPNKRNIIFGMEGDDRITAGDSGDLIFGNQGRDVIYGSKGDNFIFGGKGLDYLYGGTGNNTIYADLDGALIWGGKGTNNVYTMPVNRPNDSVYPISYVKSGANTDNIFVELPEPTENNGMVFIHNDKGSADNLTMDSRFRLQNSCFMETRQNNQTYKWNFYSFTTPANGQKVGIWLLGNINKIQYAPVSFRNYQTPQLPSATVNMANNDANALKQDFKIPFFDMNNAKTIDNILTDCNQSGKSSSSRSSRRSEMRSQNYYSNSNSNNRDNRYYERNNRNSNYQFSR